MIHMTLETGVARVLTYENQVCSVHPVYRKVWMSI